MHRTLSRMFIPVLGGLAVTFLVLPIGDAYAQEPGPGPAAPGVGVAETVEGIRGLGNAGLAPDVTNRTDANRLSESPTS